MRSWIRNFKYKNEGDGLLETLAYTASYAAYLWNATDEDLAVLKDAQQGRSNKNALAVAYSRLHSDECKKEEQERNDTYFNNIEPVNNPNMKELQQEERRWRARGLTTEDIAIRREKIGLKDMKDHYPEIQKQPVVYERQYADGITLVVYDKIYGYYHGQVKYRHMSDAKKIIYIHKERLSMFKDKDFNDHFMEKIFPIVKKSVDYWDRYHSNARVDLRSMREAYREAHRETPAPEPEYKDKGLKLSAGAAITYQALMEAQGKGHYPSVQNAINNFSEEEINNVKKGFIKMEQEPEEGELLDVEMVDGVAYDNPLAERNRHSGLRQTGQGRRVTVLDDYVEENTEHVRQAMNRNNIDSDLVDDIF